MLDLPLVKVVGGKTAEVMGKSLDLHTVEDLLRHYPRRYISRGDLTDFASLRADEHVTVVGEVSSVSERPMRNRRGKMLEVVLRDGSGSGRSLTLTFFKQPWRKAELRLGARGMFAGKVSFFRSKRQLTHPDYQLLPEDADGESVGKFLSELTPIYPATAGLNSWNIAKAIRTQLDVLGDVDDPLPAALRAEYGLVDLRTALQLVHQPASRAEADAARRRLRWEEAFVLQVVLAQRRAAARALPAVPRKPADDGLLTGLDAALPFELTEGQREVEAEIFADLAQSHPMHRLLQGDVGAGKTVLALRAMLAVVDSGGQAALLAPTEVLAQQHHRSITAMLGPMAQGGQLGGAELATRVALLTGSAKAPARRAALLDITTGAAGIVIGTHALLQDPVDFFDLGLVVVDEQHRFGVEQRSALQAKAATPPHVLVMTATPIPRTVAMTVFGDLDVSTLRQLPAGRMPIETRVVPGQKPAWIARAWQRIREEVAVGHRAYVVCPRIGDDRIGDDSIGDDSVGGDADENVATADVPPDFEDHKPPDDDNPSVSRRPAAAVVEVLELLRSGPLADLRVEALHGRLPPDEKDTVMTGFAAGDLDVLVATTVIEVGVDVPEATVMVIVDADRFGVSQLHQLRGRVGRGSAGGLCLLLTDAPEGSPARQRLEAVAATTDGFELARVDLETRREGDVLGSVQSGRRSSLRLLSVLRDEDVIDEARGEAARLVAEDPQLTQHPVLGRAIEVLLETERAEYLVKG